MGGPRTARLGAAALRRSSPRGPRARQLGAYGKSFVALEKMLRSGYLVAKIGFLAAENGPPTIMLCD